MNLRKIRITLATVSFVGLTLLFLDITGTLHHWLGWLARIQALEAVMALNVGVIALLVIGTLLAGRIYCSIICPLGIFQDLLAWPSQRRRKHRYSYSPAKKWLRYGMAAIFVLACILGIGSAIELLAPYSAFGRVTTMLLQPIWQWGNNVLASFAESMDSYAFYTVDVWMKSLPVLFIAIGTVVILAVLAWRGGRTYCNTICPVGTMLSFLSRYSWWRIVFSEDKCRHCSLCSKSCKAACIDYKNMQVDYSRCVVCGNCLEACHFDALHYTPVKYGKRNKVDLTMKNSEEQSEAMPDAAKRSFLLATAMATTAALAQDAKKVDGGLAAIEEKAIPLRQTPLTPPGSLSARNMVRRCTGCQLCVSECPNGVLRPSTDWQSLMKPTMSYERGYCRLECTRCSEVCPAGAITPISREEKTSIQIGHAVWIKSNCVAVTDGVECGNCARHCPAGAITMVALDENDDLSPMVPAVNETSCIGCGACEYVCPARPFSAIYVEGHEVHKEK